MLKRLRLRLLRSLARLTATLANSLAVLARILERRLAATQGNDPDAPVDEAVAEVMTQPPHFATADDSIQPDVSTAPDTAVPQSQSAQPVYPAPQQVTQTTPAPTKTTRDDSSSFRQVDIREAVPLADGIASHCEPAAARMAAPVPEVIPPLLPAAADESVRAPQADTGRTATRTLRTQTPASRAANDSVENNTVEPAAGLQSVPYGDVSGLPPQLERENDYRAVRERTQVVTLDPDARQASVPDFSAGVAASSSTAGIAPASAVPEEMPFAPWCTAKAAAELPRSDQSSPWPELLPAADSTSSSQNLQWPFALEQKLRAVQHVHDMTHEQAGKAWNA